MHYVDEGSGPVLLMLHGQPAWSFLYRDVIKALRSDFRCIAPDMLGYGLSERPDRYHYGYTPQAHVGIICELIKHLDLRDIILVSHDWAGPIGMGVATAEHPRIRGLALGNVWYWSPTPKFWLFSAFMATPIGRWLLLQKNFFVERMLPNWTNRTLSDEEMHHYREPQSSPKLRWGVAELARQIRLAKPWLTELELRVQTLLANKPTLITWPMQDRTFAPLLKRVQKTFPGHKLVKLETANHYYTEDAPEKVADAIRQHFLEP
jgi:haloalkane dehalogenase